MKRDCVVIAHKITLYPKRLASIQVCKISFLLSSLFDMQQTSKNYHFFFFELYLAVNGNSNKRMDVLIAPLCWWNKSLIKLHFDCRCDTADVLRDQGARYTRFFDTAVRLFPSNINRDKGRVFERIRCEQGQRTVVALVRHQTADRGDINLVSIRKRGIRQDDFSWGINSRVACEIQMESSRVLIKTKRNGYASDRGRIRTAVVLLQLRIRFSRSAIIQIFICPADPGKHVLIGRPHTICHGIHLVIVHPKCELCQNTSGPKSNVVLVAAFECTVDGAYLWWPVVVKRVHCLAPIPKRHIVEAGKNVIGDTLEPDERVIVDGADLFRRAVPESLQDLVVRESGNKEQRVGKYVTNPGLIEQIVPYNISCIDISRCQLLPVCRKCISKAVIVLVQSSKRVSDSRR